MTLTENQIARVVSDYSKIAGEAVSVEQVGGTVYVFCSELGTLRLFRKMPNKRQGFSVYINMFFFAFEI